MEHASSTNPIFLTPALVLLLLCAWLASNVTVVYAGPPSAPNTGFEIDWYTLGSGAQDLAGGNLSLTGAVASVGAGSPKSGPYELNSGLGIVVNLFGNQVYLPLLQR